MEMIDRFTDIMVSKSVEGPAAEDDKCPTQERPQWQHKTICWKQDFAQFVIWPVPHG